MFKFMYKLQYRQECIMRV